MPRNLSPAMLAHLGGSLLTITTLVKIVRNDGVTLGLSSFDRELQYDGVTYHPMDGIDATALRTTQSVGVDSVDLQGLLSSSFITDADLLAGQYDSAHVQIFMVNWAQAPLVDAVVLATGYMGNVSYHDGGYTAEIRALSSRLTQTIGEQTSGTCRVFALGDARCKVKLFPIAISAIAPVTPTTMPATTLITTAVPHGRVPKTVLAGTPGGQVGPDTVFITDCQGMTGINSQVQAVQSVPSSTQLTILFDCSALPAYTGGGKIGYQFSRVLLTAGTTPGPDSPGQRLVFDGDITPPAFYSYGRVSFSSGLNAGISREVKKHSVPIFGQATLDLQESFPFACSPGDVATLEAGCDRTLPVCDSRFRNTINWRAENLIPGIDQLFKRPPFTGG